MIMLILAPLVGVLGALLLAYGAWLIYPPAGFVVAGALCLFWSWLWRVILTVHSRLSAEVNSVLFGIISTKK